MHAIAGAAQPEGSESAVADISAGTADATGADKEGAAKGPSAVPAAAPADVAGGAASPADVAPDPAAAGTCSAAIPWSRMEPTWSMLF